MPLRFVLYKLDVITVLRLLSSLIDPRLEPSLDRLAWFFIKLFFKYSKLKLALEMLFLEVCITNVSLLPLAPVIGLILLNGIFGLEVVLPRSVTDPCSSRLNLFLDEALNDEIFGWM